MYADLREYLSALDSRGMLSRVKVEVDPHLEVAEILRRQMYRMGNAVLFEKVKGFPDWRIVGNIFGGMEFFKVAFGVERLESIGERFTEMLAVRPVGGFGEKVRALGKVMSMRRFIPKVVSRGPVREVELSSMDEVPALKTWPKDGGRYLTYPLVFTKDPETGVQDIGVYRVQIKGGRKVIVHWQVHKNSPIFLENCKRRGRDKLHVAIAVGADPATAFTGVAPVPYPMDKLFFAGLVAGGNIEVMKVTEDEILVPARAELLIEGYVRPDEVELEGPFGDHWGYYTPPDYFSVMHVERITCREDPILHATVVGKPPLEDAWIGKAVERVFLPLIKVLLPEVVDINLPVHGMFQGVAIVSIRKRFPGHARKVMMGLWGLGQFSLTRIIVVVDEDVDVHDMNQVLYAVASTVDPRRDVLIVEGAANDQIDHTTPTPGYGSKMGVDATRKFKEEYGAEWPEEVEPDEETARLVDRRWGEYGL